MPRYFCFDIFIALDCPERCGECETKNSLQVTDTTSMTTTTAHVTTDTTESPTNRKLIKRFSLSNNNLR